MAIWCSALLVLWLFPVLVQGSWSNPSWRAGTTIPRKSVTKTSVVTGKSAPPLLGPVRLRIVPTTRITISGVDRVVPVLALGLTMRKGPSPLKLRVPKEFLDRYPNRVDVGYLWAGFMEAAGQAFLANNLTSLNRMEQVVRDKIGKEVCKGRVLGPFSTLPLLDLRVSPLDWVPKKAAGEFHLIHHLFFHKGSSVNEVP